MCLLASERLLHLTYHKTVSQKVSPPQIPLSWLLNCGCHCSPLKCCSRGPNIASYPTIDKCSGVQINLYLKFTKKKLSQTYTFHPSIHLTYHKTVSRTYTIYPSIYPSFHPSIYLTYHKNYLNSYI